LTKPAGPDAPATPSASWRRGTRQGHLRPADLTRTARLIAEHATLHTAIGGAPSHWACYRFAAKLREHGDMLTTCIDRVLATLHAAYPQMGQPEFPFRAGLARRRRIAKV
jgi:hypothetical protein